MRLYLVAIPMFDSKMQVHAYRLCIRSGDSVLSISKTHSMSEVLQSPGLDVIEEIGPEPFAGAKPLLVDTNQFQLMSGMLTRMKIAPEQLVFVMPENMSASWDIIKNCKDLLARGYRLAMHGYPEKRKYNPLYKMLSYVLFDNNAKGFADTYAHADYGPGVPRVVVHNVPDIETYKALAAQNMSALFTGAFYNQVVPDVSEVMSPVKVNALQLLREVNEEDFDFDVVAGIIERDPALTISMLRFINSGTVGLKRKIDSIKSSVAILGQIEVRRWANVAISMTLLEDRPDELARISLIRAKFAENLAPLFELGVFQPSLFLLGLFSLLDVILQMPMEQAVAEVGLNEQLRDTLIKREGKFNTVLQLIYVYERADFDAATKIIIKNNVKPDEVGKAFIAALTWYYQLLRTIDSGAEEEAAQGETAAGEAADPQPASV